MLTFFTDPKASFQLLQRNGLVLVQVTVISELASAFLGLGFLLQITFEGLHLLFADVMAAVVVQLKEVPLHHALFQSVARVGLCKSAEGRCGVRDRRATHRPKTQFGCLPQQNTGRCLEKTQHGFVHEGNFHEGNY